MNKPEKQSILVCDDDVTFRKRISRMFRDRGFCVYEAGNIDEGYEVVESYELDACLVDLRMPGGSGLELVKKVACFSPSITTVVLTGFGTIQTALEAIKNGATHYLTKPAKFEEILSSLKLDTSLRKKSNSIDLDNKYPSLDDVRYEYIEKVLLECNGNITKASKILGISRRTLQRLISNR